MVFESFGSDGRWQTIDADRQTRRHQGRRARGSASSTTRTRTRLRSPTTWRFQHCFVQRFTHFLVGVDLGSPDSVAWTQQALRALLEADTSLEELLVAIVRHPAFIERRMESGP